MFFYGKVINFFNFPLLLVVSLNFKISKRRFRLHHQISNLIFRDFDLSFNLTISESPFKIHNLISKPINYFTDCILEFQNSFAHNAKMKASCCNFSWRNKSIQFICCILRKCNRYPAYLYFISHRVNFEVNKSQVWTHNRLTRHKKPRTRFRLVRGYLIQYQINIDL